MRVLSGRTLAAGDENATARVAVINQSMARANWPERTPLGERFEYDDGDPVVVVGVVADAHHESLTYRVGAPPSTCP